MSLLRALRAYVGLGPDEDYDDGYLDGYGDRVDVDLTGRNQTTRDYVRSGSNGSIRDPRVEARHVSGRRGPGGPTNRSKVSYRPDSGADSARRAGRPDGRATTPSAGATGAGSRPATHDNKTKSTVAVDDPPQTPIEASPATEQGAVVRSIDAARTRPKSVSPTSFADAKSIGDDFKLGTPIVLNLQGLDRELARRLIDFASGICYALDGGMEKVAAQVFLLIPNGCEVSESDRRLIEQRGYVR